MCVCVCVDAKQLLYLLRIRTVLAAAKQQIVPHQEYRRRTNKLLPIARRRSVLFLKFCSV